MTGEIHAKHRVMRWVVAFSVGFALAVLAFRQISDPEPRLQRAREEAVVRAARDNLRNYVPVGLHGEIVDPLAPKRQVGKVYVYPTESGWQVSGFYRRDTADRWHPFLMDLDTSTRLVSLSVRDDNDGLRNMSEEDPKLTVVP